MAHHYLYVNLTVYLDFPQLYFHQKYSAKYICRKTCTYRQRKQIFASQLPIRIASVIECNDL